MIFANSVRSVGSKKGYTYYATGLYRVRFAPSRGYMVWQLCGSGMWRRTTNIKTCGLVRDEAPVIPHVTHNSPVTPQQLEILRSYKPTSNN